MKNGVRIKNPGPSAASLGAKVLAGLAKGRARLLVLNHERRALAAVRRRVVSEYAAMDAQDGRPQRGRAGRIARKLNQKISERQVRKYLAQLISEADSLI